MEEAENSENLIEIAMDAESAKAIEVAACDGPVIYFIISRNFGLLKKKIHFRFRQINFISKFLQQQPNK